jgi:TRAP-type C4-dicarboxylate transport system permease small subunit
MTGSAMRRFLDTLYDVSAWIAGVFMVLILINIMVQVCGSYFGLYIRGTDAYAGYSMAAASFFALAHTFKRGEHIRVTLFLQRLPPRARRVAEIACLLLAVALLAGFTWYSWSMVWWSYEFHAISDAQDRTPLWIPQISMAVGVMVLFIAFVDELVRVLLGRAPVTAASESEPAHIE